MSTIIFPVGISGSGKTLLGEGLKQKLPDLTIVCMDDIRREMTGSVSDQSQNQKVWAKSQVQIAEAIARDEDVYVSATNLAGKKALVTSISELKEKFKKKNLHAIVVFLVDSKDPDACLKRVEEDIRNEKDRSRTPEDVIAKQHQRWLAMYDAPWIQERTLLEIDVIDAVATSDKTIQEIVSKVKRGQKPLK